jgi:hypothetical protein
MILLTSPNIKTPTDKQNIDNLQKEIDAIEMQVADLNKELSDIANLNIANA